MSKMPLNYETDVADIFELRNGKTLNIKDHIDNSPDWNDIYAITLKCSKADNAIDVAKLFIDEAYKICRFEQATSYFFDANQVLGGKYLYKSEKKYSDLYLGYYAWIEKSKYNLFTRFNVFSEKKPYFCTLTDWKRKSFIGFY